MTVAQILKNVERLGGKLEPAGSNLRTVLPADCSPTLKQAIRQCKEELLELLKLYVSERNESLWVYTVKQILAGEFDGLTNQSIRAALKAGLLNTTHPVCLKALDQLK